MNIHDVAGMLSVNEETLRRWEKRLEFEVPKDSRGRRKYDEEHVQLLQSIKELRDQDNGFETISRKLSLDNIDVDLSLLTNESQVVHDINTSQVESVMMLIRETETRLEDKLDSIMELSEKYSRACYEIGSLKSQLEAKDEKIKLISDSGNKDIDAVKKDLENLRMEKDNEISFLRSELERERSKKWWKRLLAG